MESSIGKGYPLSFCSYLTNKGDINDPIKLGKTPKHPW